MRSKLSWVVMTIILLCSPHYAGAATILEIVELIEGPQAEVYSFVADETPLIYRVTLTDFEYTVPFDSLSVSITTSTDVITQLLAPGMTTFDAEFGRTHFANVFATPGVSPSALGQFGILVESIPEPTTALLLSFGLIGLAISGRRRRV